MATDGNRRQRAARRLQDDLPGRFAFRPLPPSIKHGLIQCLVAGAQRLRDRCILNAIRMRLKRSGSGNEEILVGPFWDRLCFPSLSEGFPIALESALRLVCRGVGATRFERATSCSQSRRSTKLSYAPSSAEAPILAHNDQMPNDFLPIRPGVLNCPVISVFCGFQKSRWRKSDVCV